MLILDYAGKKDRSSGHLDLNGQRDEEEPAKEAEKEWCEGSWKA